MAWNLRVRGGSGQATISNLSGNSTCSELHQVIAEKLNVAVDKQELLAGFPPKVIQVSMRSTSHPESSMISFACYVERLPGCVLV